MEDRRGGEGRDPFTRSITIEYPPMTVKPLPIFSRSCETDRSNGSSSVRELGWEIKLMTFEYSNTLNSACIRSYVEANNTHRWGRWTGMKREVRLQLGLGERWFNRAWKLLWQLWKLSFSRTTCNKNVLRRHWSIPISNLTARIRSFVKMVIIEMVCLKIRYHVL